MVLVGAGNLGKAIGSYEWFREEGFDIGRSFDPILQATTMGVVPFAPSMRSPRILRKSYGYWDYCYPVRRAERVRLLVEEESAVSGTSPTIRQYPIM